MQHENCINSYYRERSVRYWLKSSSDTVDGWKKNRIIFHRNWYWFIECLLIWLHAFIVLRIIISFYRYFLMHSIAFVSIRFQIECCDLPKVDSSRWHTKWFYSILSYFFLKQKPENRSQNLSSYMREREKKKWCRLKCLHKNKTGVNWGVGSIKLISIVLTKCKAPLQATISGCKSMKCRWLAAFYRLIICYVLQQPADFPNTNI